MNGGDFPSPDRIGGLYFRQLIRHVLQPWRLGAKPSHHGSVQKEKVVRSDRNQYSRRHKP